MLSTYVDGRHLSTTVDAGVVPASYPWHMRRQLKGLVFSIVAAKLGRLLHRRGHSGAARYLEHELHRRAGHGHGHGHGHGQGYRHYGYHGHYHPKSEYGHYGYHGHYRPKKRKGRRYW
jgi:hypothetical protein